MNRLELLTKWNRMIVRLQIEHEVSARFFEKFNWKLGIPCVILSVVVSGSAFNSINDLSSVGWRYAAGILSLLTLVLSSVQTFLNFDTRAAGHKDIAEKLGAISREIQDEIASGKDEALLGPIVFDIRKRMDSILLDAPTLPKSTIRRLGDVRVYTETPPAEQDTVPARTETRFRSTTS